MGLILGRGLSHLLFHTINIETVDKNKNYVAGASKKYGPRHAGGILHDYAKVNDINLMLSAHSREFLKDFRVVLPPRLLSKLRHSLAGLSDASQQYVCDEVVSFLRCGVMHRSGFDPIDHSLGLLLLELMNEPDIVYPPF